MIKTIAWSMMTLLALLVAAYAASILLIVDFRPPLVRELLAEQTTMAIGHFVTGALALLAGALQLNSQLRLRFLTLHRWLGRVYVLAVMIGGIAGLKMSLHSMGGFSAHLGFGALAVCWLGSTLLAYQFIRTKNIAAHERWMIRSYALTLAAVTLRIYLPVSQVADIPFEFAYPMIAWVSWVPNLFAAEWLIRSRNLRASR